MNHNSNLIKDVVVNSPDNPSKYTDRSHKYKKSLKKENVITEWKK